MASKKYKLTDETINFEGKTLHRIIALKDFDNIKKGDLGGFVESEKNLSQKGNCWVFNNAKVKDNAKVLYNAQVIHNALVKDNGVINGYFTRVSNNVVIKDNAKILTNSLVIGDEVVCGNTIIEKGSIIGQLKETTL